MTYYVKLTLSNGADGYLKKGAMSATERSPYMTELQAHSAAVKAEEEFKSRGIKIRATVHDWNTGKMTGVAIEDSINRTITAETEDDFCNCDLQPDEEEQASNRCKACGKYLSSLLDLHNQR